jgi:hypothetical protein
MAKRSTPGLRGGCGYASGNLKWAGYAVGSVATVCRTNANANTVLNKPTVASRIKVLSWNIDDHIALKLSCPTFRNIIKVKASKVRAIGNLVFGMESSVGILPPSEGKVLYMSLLDPHLTHGAEISLDIDPKSLQLLEDVQHALILGRLLGLGKSSVLAPLFTETGLCKT